MDKTYSIIRFYEDGEKEITKQGLSLEEAREHCQGDDTSGVIDGRRFFDGFHAED